MRNRAPSSSHGSMSRDSSVNTDRTDRDSISRDSISRDSTSREYILRGRDLRRGISGKRRCPWQSMYLPQ